MHIADNQDALLDYLYEEGDPTERLRIATHLRECAGCSVALLELQTVRGLLSEWKPPASQLGFRIVQDRGTGAPGLESQPRPPRGAWARSSRFGGWAQAAAGVMLFVAGLAVSQLNVEHMDGAIVVRWAPEVPAPSGSRTASIQLPPSPEVQVQAPSGSSPSVPVAVNAESTEQLLQRVRAMIEQSEGRQQRELALRLSQVASEVDAQHQADLQRIQQRIELETGEQRQMMERLVRTGGQP